MPVYLSVNFIIGHFADFIGSMWEQVPDLNNSDVNLFINVSSLTDGRWHRRSMSDFGKFRPVAHDPKTHTFASGYAQLITFVMRSTTL
jgi:hypothetical protein